MKKNMLEMDRAQERKRDTALSKTQWQYATVINQVVATIGGIYDGSIEGRYEWTPHARE